MIGYNWFTYLVTPLVYYMPPLLIVELLVELLD
jgi:hypothetical protein